MQISFRKATKKDSQIIALLSAQLGYPSSQKEIANRLEKILKEKNTIVLVAEDSKKIIGWIHAFIAHRVESDPFAEIGGLVIDEKCRGKGIGKILCNEIENWCRKKSIKKLRVRSNIIRKEAHQFYIALGYTEEKQQKVFGKKI